MQEINIESSQFWAHRPLSVGPVHVHPPSPVMRLAPPYTLIIRSPALGLYCAKLTRGVVGKFKITDSPIPEKADLYWHSVERNASRKAKLLPSNKGPRVKHRPVQYHKTVWRSLVRAPLNFVVTLHTLRETITEFCMMIEGSSFHWP